MDLVIPIIFGAIAAVALIFLLIVLSPPPLYGPPEKNGNASKVMHPIPCDKHNPANNNYSLLSIFSGVPFLAGIVRLTLPFMQIFSIDAGFPLKIYELANLLWAGMSVITLQITVFDKRLFLRSLLFFVYTLIALPPDAPPAGGA
jgi:hypothetical protein